MAYWFRKKGIQVYVCYMRSGKPVSLPRAKTKHLDGDEPHNLDAFCRQIERQYEGGPRKITPENLSQTNSELGQNLESYFDFLISRGKSPNTVGWHKSALEKYVVRFFLEGDTPLRDPVQWPGKSIRLFQWLIAQNTSESTIKRVNIALRGFYRYLVEEGRIQTGVDIRLRNPVIRDKTTPLPRILEPEEILAFIEQAKDPAIKLTALLGYFFSLRPQEIFALRPMDFVAGTKATELECCRIMHAKGLFFKLAVNVQRQKTKNGKFTVPKAYSSGFVACFNAVAAKTLVYLLRQVQKPDRALFGFSPDWHLKLWRRHGIEGITVKSLRRASLYYLAHHTKMNDLVALMKHARHKKAETTMLYLRRPEETIEFTGELDLES